jgi:hypothetical protein
MQLANADANDNADDDQDDAEDSEAAAKPVTTSPSERRSCCTATTIPSSPFTSNSNVRSSWDEDRVQEAPRHSLEPLRPEARSSPPTSTSTPDLKADVRRECEKLGRVESIHVFEGSPAGVIAVKFADWLGADRCVRTMTGRRFDRAHHRRAVLRQQDRLRRRRERRRARRARRRVCQSGSMAPTRRTTPRNRQEERNRTEDDDDDGDDGDDGGD